MRKQKLVAFYAISEERACVTGALIGNVSRSIPKQGWYTREDIRGIVLLCVPVNLSEV